jgi:hypothetical protein
MMATNRAAVRAMGVAVVSVGMFLGGAAQGQSCLSTASSTEKASSSKRDYVFSTSGKAVDARGVTWSNISDHALFLDGSAQGCWAGGRIDGPYPEDAVYECSSEHGYTGGTCYDYHTTAGMAPNDGKRIVDDLHLKDYGDGISVESGSGDIVGRRIWFENIHDDAFETDWAQQSFSCVDCLFDKVFMGFAYRRRSSASDATPKSGWTMELRNSLVRLHRFTHSYKEKPGHGGLFKDDSVAPRFIVTDNVFLMGPVAGSGQVQFPLIGQTTECRNNTLLWQGSLSAYQDMLETGDSSDGATNGERLDWLNRQFGNCYTVIVKPSSQSATDFLAQRWNPLVNTWKSTHPAAGGSGAPAPAPAPVDGVPQEPILLP